MVCNLGRQRDVDVGDLAGLVWRPSSPFEKAVTEGGDFTPDTTILVMNIVRGALLAVLAGYLAAAIARENRRSTLILGVLLVAFCVLIMSMAKSYVPLWYMILFTLVFLPMTMLGGKLKKFA